MTEVYLKDLLDLTELSQMMDEKRIAKQVHPNLPISIYNYTNRAQFIGKWTESERICRGLIVEDKSGKVIARGPSKFFNYGQTGAPEVDLESWVRVSRKEDGSLGIGWTYKGQHGIATRGSFASEQAIYANEKLFTSDDKANIDWASKRGYSRIWEIVYPDNRIVLDYKGREELIPLGTVSNHSGLITYRPLPVIMRDIMHIKDALRLPIPADEEGYVLDVFNDSSVVTGHVKLKGEEYKILHGLLTNTNARRIWIQLAARACHQTVKELAVRNEKDPDKLWATYVGADPEDFKRVKVDQDLEETLLTNVPDEFYDWVTKKIDAINDRVSDLIAQSNTLAGQISLISDKRKRFEAVKDHVMCAEIIRFAETRDPSGILLKAWKLAKPEGDDNPFKTVED